jgi:TetR/AcrR family transcriptional regulator, mexCD-oprJ operon repressor
MPARSTSLGAPQPRRADAQRNIARILDAAVVAFADDQDASMAAIARRAGVARATLYVHFPTRDALIAAVTDRAIAETSAALSAAEPEAGEPVEALARVVAAAWRMLGGYHALVAVNASLGPERLRALHEPVLGQIAPLVERGRKSGAFGADVPLHWQLTVVLELVHAASREVSAGRLPEDVAERALLTSVAGALAP